ncbi:hypothetical protein HELRODRAFT_150039, partial [Helobdella robusta]|uniref:FERM domain-containing protein n=1 Tax=Helobdella robusta TaxID=6412 RepID=T1EKE0_HELRO
SILICNIQFLDGTNQDFVIPKKSYGSFLLKKAFEHVDLLEVDYFGLQFTDPVQNINRWLEFNKQVKKQYSGSMDSSSQLRVKFYSSQPSNLKEEITRYYVYLQLKEDIRVGRLACPDDVAMELGALVIQAELGDYDSAEHTLEVVAQFDLVPKQTKEIEVGVLENYKKLKGMSPSQSELSYLNKARWLEAYGVDFHDVKGRDDNDYRLGLVPTGILVFEGSQRIGLFYWPKITKLQFKKKKLILNVVESDDKGVDQEHTFVFRSSSDRACKHLWKCAVEHHAFYRLSGPTKSVTVRSPFFRLGSKFRYSGNTELQSLTSTRARRSVTFERRSSQKRPRFQGQSSRST